MRTVAVANIIRLPPIALIYDLTMALAYLQRNHHKLPYLCC